MSGFDPAFPFFVDGIPCPVAGRSGGRILLAKVRFSEKCRLIIERPVTLPTSAYLSPQLAERAGLVRKSFMARLTIPR